MGILSEVWEEKYYELKKVYSEAEHRNAGLIGENTKLRNTNKALEEDLHKWENFLRENAPNLIVWHYLTKNPKDLPLKDCKNYLAYVLDDEEPAIFHYIASENGQWELMPNKVVFFTNSQVKRWCEIPTSKEE